MKITYIKLENFVNIYAGMKKKVLEIDLSKSKNNLCVIVGPNGSGKTSILSELHPFATSGNMDVRNDANLIMEGHDGYKEVHILDGDSKYIIKHNYMNKNKTKSTKSFISKNGTELNANGNVRSFKEIVLDELGIDQDLLKLMRLGSNVTSLVDLKSTSRKSFATKLFSDIDIYGGFFKKVSAECRNTKAILKNLSDKIAKYNITDEGEFQKQIDITTIEIGNYEHLKDTYIKELGIIDSKLSEINVDDEQSVISLVDSLQKQIDDASSMMTLIQNLNITKAEYELNYEKEKNSMLTHYNQLENDIKMKLFERDTLYTQKQDLDVKVQKAVSAIKIKDLQQSIEKYEKNISEHEIKLEGRVRYDKNFLLKFKEHVDEINAMIRELGHFSVYDIKDIAQSVLDKRNISEYIETSRSKMSKEYETINAEIINIEKMDLDIPTDIPDNACSNDCPFKKFYYNMVGRKNDLKELIERRNHINKALMSNEELYNLHNLILIIRDKAQNFAMINDLPVPYSSEVVLEALANNKPIININLLNLAIDDSEMFEELDKFKESLELVNKEYQLIKDYGVDVIEVENQILEVDEKIKDINNSIEAIERDKIVSESIINNLNKEAEEIIKALTLKESLSSIEEDLEKGLKRLNEINEDKNKLKELENSYNSLNAEISRVTEYLKSLTGKKELLTYSLQDYQKLTMEHEAISLLFKEADEIRDALNSSSGIPLLYLKVYLKNCPTMMNNLLQSVYDNKLNIDEFLINDTEFRIPYSLNGLKAPDIIMSSQGERSFISIVLSLSLIIQSMTKYNIICLDELDGPLDTNNRTEFIKVLYSFINMVGCEQVFLITHNNMFDNEPVDIIETKDNGDDNFKFGNYVYKG